jgi:hypothetical protein
MLLYDSALDPATQPIFFTDVKEIDVVCEPSDAENSIDFGGGTVTVNLHRAYINTSNANQDRYTYTFGPAIPIHAFSADSTELARKIDRAGGNYGISVTVTGATSPDLKVSIL